MTDQRRPRSGDHKMGRALFSVDTALWQRFGELTTNRAEVLRHFIAWYVGTPGVKTPRRPKAQD